MGSNFKYGPKVVPLAETETLSSIERWRQNVLYLLRLNEEFRPFMGDSVVFGKKSRSHPCRGFTDDTKTEKNEADEDVVTVTVSKEDKCFTVDLMLDQIANFAPLIPRNDITRDSGSLKEVWSKIRLYHNLEKSGALMNDCFNIQRKEDESPQALFARLKQCFDDNLLSAGGLRHVDGPLDEDEEMSPSLMNTVILLWLQLLHPKLRNAVTQRFSTQLRDSTFSALFPEISRSVNSLLEDLNGDASANRVFYNQPYRSRPVQGRNSYNKFSPRSSQKKSCEYCLATGKKAFYTHVISDCLFIKRENQKGSTVSKQVECEKQESDFLQEQYDEYYQLTGEVVDQDACRIVEHVISAVSTNASPVLILNKNGQSYTFTLDTGCTGSVIPKEEAVSLNAVIKPTNQRARTADGKLMNIIGETEVTLFRNNKKYHLNTLVCADKTDLLAGMPFLKSNDIGIRPATDEIIVDGHDVIKYDPVRKLNHNAACRVTSFTIQSEARQVLLPGESGLFSVKGVVGDRQEVVVEPRWDSSINKSANKDSRLWPSPKVVPVINNTVSLVNTSSEPVIVKKAEHIAHIQPQVSPEVKSVGNVETSVIPNLPPKKTSDYSANVVLNPDNMLPPSIESSFKQLLKEYDEVFNPAISVYNGKRGKCVVEVNIGKSLPPQRKGRLPFYSRDNLKELQMKFDELEAKGVFSSPQDIGVTVENTNPSFLVAKPNSTDKRLVTDFSSIADYCRPTPSLLPEANSTLRTVGGFRYAIETDMTIAYHQMELDMASRKFCGVHTPYKGLRVYNVGCMGLPGVEVALEELTCRVVGDLVQEGKVAKLADDFYVGGDTPEELLENFRLVLHRFLECNLKLSARKTKIAPKSMTVLGWSWSSGQLKASPHRLTALSTCSPPDSVTAMRSYTGAYRFLSRVLSGYAKLLAPLEAACRGKEGKEKVVWTEDLHVAFKRSQEALLDAKTITVPRPSDILWIVTDAAVRPSAIGATLYAVRDSKPLLAGFFNSKLPEFQSRWLPCELEGLAVAAALNHYAPYIIQSHHKPQVLTDSKAVVQAAAKFRRGEFSISSRLTTFTSLISKHGAQLQHLPGAVNIPSDYASRHPLTCGSPHSCQVCKFLAETSDCVVQEISISDVIEGKIKLPFTNRSAWKEVQRECSDLRKVADHIKRGTTPNRKSKNLRTVRKYMARKLIMSADGLLVHRSIKPLTCIDQIVVPQSVTDGILTALHLKLQHPTSHQLVKAFSRYFYCLNLDQAVSMVSKSCHHCNSIKDVPKSLIEQSTSDPPSHVGVNYAADIIKRCKQKIFIIRETTTSYTLAEFINDETKKEVTSALVRLCNIMKPSKLSPIKVRLDPAPAHQSMLTKIASDTVLNQNNITLELGRSLNPNKNPVVDKAIRELHRELVSVNPTGGPVSSMELSRAVACLNSRIRATGMSAYEHWTQRDQETGDQLPLDDREIILQQHHRRIANHHSSEKSKAAGRVALPSPKISVGSLVYLYADRDKTVPRQRYIVTELGEDGCYRLRKFTSQLFQKKVYEVKPNEVFTVPQYYTASLPSIQQESSDDESDYGDCVEEERDDVRDGASLSGESGGVTEESASSGSDDDDPVVPTVPRTFPVVTPPVELTAPESSPRRLRTHKNINYCESP